MEAGKLASYSKPTRWRAQHTVVDEPGRVRDTHKDHRPYKKHMRAHRAGVYTNGAFSCRIFIKRFGRGVRHIRNTAVLYACQVRCTFSTKVCTSFLIALWLHIYYELMAIL